MDPVKFSYKAMAEPPLTPEYLGGLNLTLTAKSSGFIYRDAPILFQKIRVGSVERVRLGKKAVVDIDIYIEPEFVGLVKKQSHFWNVSGLKVGGSLGNIEVDMGSVASLLIGGIAFSSPEGEAIEAAGNGDHFSLYANEEDTRDSSTTIEIVFSSDEKISEGTLIKYRQQTIGEVRSTRLSHDLETIVATARLNGDAAELARQGAVFWVVKPELGLAETENLDTLISGVYIKIQRGEGKRISRFEGRGEPPLKKEKSTGLNLVLTTADRSSIDAGVKILYRSVAVGEVKGYELADNAQQVLIYINIEERYAPLIHDNTRFWNTSGFGLDFGLFSGAKVRTDSVESLLEGGIALATPDNDAMGEPATEGAVFQLEAEAKDEWKFWQPDIPLADSR